MKKFLGFLALLLVVGAGYQFGFINLETTSPTGHTVVDQTTPQIAITQPINQEVGRTQEDSLLLASFNIQVFGKSKVQKELAQEYLPQIIKQFDVIAIQELRDSSSTTLDTLETWFPEYEYVVSERLGRSSSKEQYILLYNPTKVSITNEYEWQDIEDNFEREPYITTITYNNQEIQIVHNHLKPSEVEQEMQSLEEVVQTLQGEIIILGDMNADCSYYDEEEAFLTTYNEIITDNYDTTVATSDCTYDRIFTSLENTGARGVFNFGEIYDLTQEQEKIISDHYPVWVEII